MIPSRCSGVDSGRPGFSKPDRPGRNTKLSMNTPAETNSSPSRIPTFRRLVGLVINRRTLFFVALLASLVALFYAEENWRGHRAWQRCKSELEAKGEVLDWSAYVPKRVPEAENMMRVPLVESLFVRSSRVGKADPSNEELGRLKFKIDASLATKEVGGRHGRENVTLAEVIVLLPDSGLVHAPDGTILTLSD
ncbi:MAG: hypothetical protein KGS61_17390, partial [Verrucomicrobia bacterium]|nr:hypothetical protein [Verrucomicrobiota bacterium]